MPNQSLIQTLETLRETYSQQQKTATALQASFKAVTNSQTKTRRALEEYLSHETNVDVRPAHEAFAGLRLKEEAIDPITPQLRREIKLLAKLTTALRDAAAALQSEPVDVARLSKASASLQNAPQPPIQALLPELNEEIDLAQRALGDEFGQKLRQALLEQNLTIGGRPPRFAIGRFELDANFAGRFMTLRYGKDMVMPRVAIRIDAALKAYADAVKRLSGRTNDGKNWIGQFYEAYQTVHRKRGSNEARVNIVDCYIELVLLRQNRNFASEPSKTTFTDYSRAQFIYDFYDYASQQRLSHNGWFVKAHSATKSQTDNPAKSMWMVEGDSPYDGRYIADIEFVKD